MNNIDYIIGIIGVIGFTLCVIGFFIAIIVMLVMLCSDPFITKNDIGRNHCGLVTFNSSGGDIHFDEMNYVETIDCLKRTFWDLKDFPTYEDGHTGDFIIFTNKLGDVKTIGYTTSEKVVFEGKEYYFPER